MPILWAAYRAALGSTVRPAIAHRMRSPGKRIVRIAFYAFGQLLEAADDSAIWDAIAHNDQSSYHRRSSNFSGRV